MPGSPTNVHKPALQSHLAAPTVSSDDTFPESFAPMASPRKSTQTKPRNLTQPRSPLHKRAGPVRGINSTPKQSNARAFSFIGFEDDVDVQAYLEHEKEHVSPSQTSGNGMYSVGIEERNPPSCSRETRDEERQGDWLSSSSGENGSNALERLAAQDLYNLITPKKSIGEKSGMGRAFVFDCVEKRNIQAVQSSCPLTEIQQRQITCAADKKSGSSIKKLFCFVKRSSKNKMESIEFLPSASQESRDSFEQGMYEQDLQRPFLSEDIVCKKIKEKTPKRRQRRWFKAVVQAVRGNKRGSNGDGGSISFPFPKDGVSKLSSEPRLSESLDSSSGILASLSKEKDDESLSSIDLLVGWLQCSEIEGVDPICSKDNPRSMLVVTSSGSRELIEAFTDIEEVEYQDTKLKQLRSPRDNSSDTETNDMVGRVLQLPNGNLRKSVKTPKPAFRKFAANSVEHRSKQFTRRSSFDAPFSRQSERAFVHSQVRGTDFRRKASAASGRHPSLGVRQLGHAGSLSSSKVQPFERRRSIPLESIDTQTSGRHRPTSVEHSQSQGTRYARQSPASFVHPMSPREFV